MQKPTKELNQSISRSISQSVDQYTYINEAVISFISKYGQCNWFNYGSELSPLFQHGWEKKRQTATMTSIFSYLINIAPCECGTERPPASATTRTRFRCTTAATVKTITTDDAPTTRAAATRTRNWRAPSGRGSEKSGGSFGKRRKVSMGGARIVR